MTKEVKAFITREDFITASNTTESPIYELSELAHTYSKSKKTYYSTVDPTYDLYAFKITGTSSELTQVEVNAIVNVVKSFTTFISTEVVSNKLHSIVLFTNNYNGLNPTTPITDLNYNSLVTYSTIKTPDYITFNVLGVTCNIWLSGEVFKIFYPEYDVNIVLPFVNFVTVVGNPGNFLTALNGFNIIEFNNRIEANKAGLPTTLTKILNIPYRAPGTTTLRDCYFAFNVYGMQGSYDFILKLELYKYLTETCSLDGSFIENVFPSILSINEFFITPRWDNIAIPSSVGVSSISSQISSAFSSTYDLDKFIKIYSNDTYMRNNTYNVPTTYNNLLLHVTNGLHSDDAVKDFRLYYKDFMNISSTHPDFARMTMRTQRFITLLENILDVSNAGSPSEMFNKLINNTDYRFSLITRGTITYLSYFYEEHQYYVIPRFEFINRL